MELFETFIRLFKDTESLLTEFITNYGVWVYAILFLIIFIETGFVVMPFLPGDSLLFIVGMLAGAGKLDLLTVLGSLSIAAILGDTLNYYLGRTIGKKILTYTIGKRQLVKDEHLKKAEDFYEKHGPISIVLARFVPIVRTFAPFVAGIAKMQYRKFALYNIAGGVVWICSFVLLGVWLGEIEWVKKNIEKMAIAIVFLSVLPIVWGYVKSRFEKK